MIQPADAARARLAPAAVDDTLRIEVADDGHGFGFGRTGGVGLASMRHRAEALGGTLEVTTGQQGTTVVARLPLRARR